MAILDEIITQLKTYAPVFAGNIAGAAAFETGIQSVVNLPYPSCFVMPLSETANLNSDLTGLYQSVDERYAVIVEVDASSDRRGQTAVTSLPELRAAIFAAILNWSPASIKPNAPRALAYVGYIPLMVDRARLFCQWEFSIETLITDADGFQITGVPLDDVQLNDADIGLTVDIPIAT